MESRRNPTRYLSAFVFASRWSLYPIIVGLVLANVAYVIRFLIEDIQFLRECVYTSTEEGVVGVLGLVDVAMVANLILMTTQGSYQIFISKFAGKHGEQHEQPQWLDHIDSGLLKIKIALSVAGITLIRLLKDFVNIENLHWELIVHRMWIHMLCLGSAIAMAVVWRLTHETAHDPVHDAPPVHELHPPTEAA